MKLYAENREHIVLPYIDQRWNAKITFDTIQFNLDKNIFADGILQLQGVAKISDFIINHPKVAANDVIIKNASMEYSLNIGENYFELDSSSYFSLNKIVIYPYTKYQRSPEKEITLKLNIDKIPAQDFFASLPKGMFKNLDGVEAQGFLNYNLTFDVDMNLLDSLHFSFDLKKENFKLTRGQSNFTRINEPFEYNAYEKGQLMQTFIVGRENPNFVPLGNISELLKNTILTAEDGAFFYHRGFNEEMFGKSIAANIKAGKFMRGGSTISMQLVKNVFLSRNKTIARKLEEALIVWLIENNHLVSKERMFEVYLNIIEWGPNMYGVGEASKFYFNKKPADLSLAECIFLTSIIPGPKMFKYSFDEKGNLKGNLAAYYKLISGILLHKLVITDMEYEQLKPNIELKGEAKKLVLPTDSVPSDSLFMERMELLN